MHVSALHCSYNVQRPLNVVSRCYSGEGTATGLPPIFLRSEGGYVMLDASADPAGVGDDVMDAVRHGIVELLIRMCCTWTASWCSASFRGAHERCRPAVGWPL